MKIFLITIYILAILIPSVSYGQENWKFVKEVEYCFIQSVPTKTLIPDGKTRGDYGILVYTMHKNPDFVVQISPGFNFKSSGSISVKIDDTSYDFYADEDTAWTNNDDKVIFAMKRGLELTSTSISSKGTKVIDTYTLKGFTKALNNLSGDDC